MNTTTPLPTTTGTVEITMKGRTYTIDLDSRMVGKFADCYIIRGVRSAVGGLFVSQLGKIHTVDIASTDRLGTGDWRIALGELGEWMLAVQGQEVAR